MKHIHTSSPSRARLLGYLWLRTVLVAAAAGSLIFSLRGVLETSWAAPALVIVLSVIGLGLGIRSILVLLTANSNAGARITYSLLALIPQAALLAFLVPQATTLTPNVLLPAHWNAASLTQFWQPIATDIATGRTPLAILGNTLALALIGIGALAILIDFTYVGLRSAAITMVPLIGVVVAGGVFKPREPDVAVFLAITVCVGLLFLIDPLTRPFIPTQRTRHTTRFTPSARYAGSFSSVTIGICAIALAVAGGMFSVLSPRVSSPENTFDVTKYGQAASGSMLDSTVDITGQLRDPQNRPLFSFSVSQPEAAGYVRVGVLPTYSNYTWGRPVNSFTADKFSTGEQVTAQPVAPYSGNDITYSFTGLNPASPTLPAPAGLRTASMVEGSGAWGYNTEGELLQFATNSDQPLAYQVTAAGETIDPASWSPGKSTEASTQSVPALLRTTADMVTSNSTTKLETALAIQNYFRGFTYDINYQTPDGYDPITGFLTSGRGYCEQFASVMALMAEYKGIDSRVVVGYIAMPNADGSYDVGTHNAHAWPELNMGTSDNPQWVRFEPTPAGPTSNYAAPTWQDNLGATETPTPDVSSSAPTPSASATPSATPSASASATASPSATPSASPSATTAGATPGGTGPGLGEQLGTWWADQSPWVRGSILALLALTGALALGFVALNTPLWWRRLSRRRARARNIAAFTLADARPSSYRVALEAALTELTETAAARNIAWAPGTAPEATFDEVTAAAAHRLAALRAESPRRYRRAQITFDADLSARWSHCMRELTDARYRPPAPESMPGETRGGVAIAASAMTATQLTQLVQAFDAATAALRPRHRWWFTSRRR